MLRIAVQPLGLPAAPTETVHPFVSYLLSTNGSTTLLNLSRCTDLTEPGHRSLQIGGKGSSQLGTSQSKFHRGLEKTQFVSDVVTPAFEHVRHHGLNVDQLADGVRQLDLASGPRRDLLEHAHDIRVKDVPA